MLNIGARISKLRKAKNWSQADLAKNINASRIMIGKYEREDNTPSVEVLFNLAKVFEVSLDYLVGEGMNAQFDKEAIKRLEGIANLEQEDQKHLYALMDAFLRDANAKRAYR